jgi:pimeloyl-ACP methyl ester carboxylesterase
MTINIYPEVHVYVGKKIMPQNVRRLIIVTAAMFAAILPLTVAAADAAIAKIGVVVLHGKGGSPTRYVSSLASTLEEKGYLVANLEMPWSGQRGYDADVSAAELQVESALGTLRGKGATKLFVVGHSQGALFALHFGNKHAVDGVVAIAPGGDVGNAIYRDRLGASVGLARSLVAEGKGNEKTKFYDYEGSRGVTPVTTTPAIYLSWFDPEGAMNQTAAMNNMNPRVPVLYIGPTGDYPGLARVKLSMFNALPKNPLHKLYEPGSSHLDAPAASLDEIVRWTAEMAEKAGAAPAGARP